jgi:hypothetical protein
MQPSVYREATIGESPRPAMHRSDFVQCRAREKYDLVLLRHDGLVAASAEGLVSTVPRIVQPQFSAFELVWFSREKIDERHLPGSDYLLCIIGVWVEEISIIACRNLHFGPRNREFFDPELLQDSGQYTQNSIQDNLLMRAQFHQNARAPMAVIGDTRLTTG